MDRKDFYFRQIVTEDDVNNSFDDVEIADHNLAVDNSIFQKVDGSNAPLATPAGTDFNALLGGIVDGLNITSATGSTVTISAGAAYDSAGNRIYVPSPVTVSLATTGVTGIGEGGSAGGIGSVNTTPAGGQFTFVLVQILFNRLLSDPREDGNSMTVFFNSAESFQFQIKVSASSASPAIPPGDPGCIILGAFELDSSNTLVSQDYSRRGDWIRTFAVYTAGPLPVDQAEDGTLGDPHFIAGTIRQAILKLRNTIGLSTTNYANHINQAAPQDRHAAKNIDYDASSANWADGTSPALGSNLGGASDSDGVQWAIDNVISIVADTTTGFGGTKRIGGASITGSPITLGAGTLRTQLTSLLTGLNNHLNASTGAHAGTAISTPAGTVFTGTDVTTQLGQIDSYINGRITNANSISGSNATPIWVYKNAKGYAGFGIDHMALASGRILTNDMTWTEVNGAQVVNGTGTWFNNWNYGLFGGSGNSVDISGPQLSSPANYPFGPVLRVLATGTGADTASVLEMGTSPVGLATQALYMDFDFSVNGGTPKATTSFAVGFGDGSFVGSASVAVIATSTADPNGAYFHFASGTASFAIATTTKNGSSSFTPSSVIMAPDQPHRGRIEIIPAAFSDDGLHHVLYYVDGVQVTDDHFNMTTVILYPFIRVNSASGATETVKLSIGHMRIRSRLATGDIFI